MDLNFRSIHSRLFNSTWICLSDMDDLGIPSRLFATGFEPRGKRRVNNYFNLRWIEVIKGALEEEDLALLNASQFGQVMRMGSHMFSVMFLPFLYME
ncbi:unnamed protein product [Eruca vesicaria subsp. sativa]|uniref:Uncharacterized protein n=1 Tax=Eruca vesicaria subsp. sativa TaxID=29727 RepID=A0ABC8L271_ERUVS|nr:unnamed protein product [Eruca vesicaria subsp. sativa]